MKICRHCKYNSNSHHGCTFEAGKNPVTGARIVRSREKHNKDGNCKDYVDIQFLERWIGVVVFVVLLALSFWIGTAQ